MPPEGAQDEELPADEPPEEGSQDEELPADEPPEEATLRRPAAARPPPQRKDKTATKPEGATAAKPKTKAATPPKTKAAAKAVAKARAATPKTGFADIATFLRPVRGAKSAAAAAPNSSSAAASSGGCPPLAKGAAPKVAAPKGAAAARVPHGAPKSAVAPKVAAPKEVTAKGAAPKVAKCVPAKAKGAEAKSPPRAKGAAADEDGWGEDGAGAKWRVGAFALNSSPSKRAEMAAQKQFCLQEQEAVHLCDRCNQPCDVMKSYPIRVTKKGQIFRCQLCSTRGVQASRTPEWGDVAAGLKDFSVEQKTAFWNGVKDCPRPSAMRKFLQETLTSTKEAGTKSANKGGYYPLSWYRRQGYPWRSIKANCKDTLDHPVLGLCYKVDIQMIERWEAHTASRSRSHRIDVDVEAEAGEEADAEGKPTQVKKKAAAEMPTDHADDHESGADPDEEDDNSQDQTDEGST